MSIRSGPVVARAAEPPSSRNLIQGGDIARKLVSRYGLREANPAPTLALEVVPVVIVDELLAESDLFNPRIRPASGFGVIGPAAASWAIRLQNPPNSRIYAHVSAFLIGGTATIASLQVRSHSPVQIADNGFHGFRTGLLGGQQCVCTIGQETPRTDTSGAILAGSRVGTSNPIIIPFDFVVVPGQSLTLEEGVANAGIITATFLWTEEDAPF